jgi:hypothetical protein
MDEMMNRMIEQMGKLTDALVMMSEKLDALKLPAVTLPLVEEAMTEAKAPVITPEPAERVSEKKTRAKKTEVPAAPIAAETKEEALPEMPTTVALSSDDVRRAIKEVMDKKGTPAAKEIINGVGNAPNVSAIPVEKYAAVISACREAVK